MKKKAGILMAISSLPSRFGIGDLGPRAYQFVDEIQQNHVKIWQILPFNRLGYGNSPYQPHSSIAGDEIFISLELLVKENLLQKDRVEPQTLLKQPFKQGRVDYDAARAFKEPLLREAYHNFLASDLPLKKEYEKFLAQEKWLYNYAVFMAFKKINNMACRLDWPKEHKTWIKDKQFNIDPLKEEIGFQQFVQFIFFQQWLALKAYANEKGIEIMGDIPFYVGIDSIDAWENQALFLLDPEGQMTFIAGVPPDYFSATGQRWGNPIYHWEVMAKDDYAFWVDRLRANMRVFDIIRIDHFRAFDTYWQIPSSCPTAIEGEWLEGPSYRFFDAIYKAIPEMNLVAEDLGEMRPEVYTLRDHYNLPGMKIIQFTFDPKENNNKFDDRENMIIYTGTHDNQTILGWYQAQPQEIQQAADDYFKSIHIHGSFSEKWLRFALQSIAKWTITPTQDLLSLDDHARMNEPGAIGPPNWEWQLIDSPAWMAALEQYGKLIKEYHR